MKTGLRYFLEVETFTDILRPEVKERMLFSFHPLFVTFSTRNVAYETAANMLL